MLRAAAPYFRQERPAICFRQTTFQASTTLGGSLNVLTVHGAIQYRLMVFVLAQCAEARGIRERSNA
jgi:hypothetical protein